MLNTVLTLESKAAVSAVVEAVGFQKFAWLLIALPALGAAILLLGGKRTNRWGHWLGVLMSWASFVVGFILLLGVAAQPVDQREVHVSVFQWLGAGIGDDTLNVSWGLLLDPLSLTFVMLVTFVGSLIHVYAVAYMEHDRARRRFFAYLNLFIAAMLTLVLSDSYLGVFFGWEGVGLVSYLLIGFWNHELPNAQAAKKAFVMNRVGDLGLLLAMMSMFAVFGSLGFREVLGGTAEGQISAGWATAIGIFLLVAACGKSAQFPLQAWLGDAMAGPTPVSALIHAATMVTAGVYLIVRSGVIYQAAPVAQLVVAIIAAITLCFGAFVGLAKDDMKKVLAGSTMSQIGYMMLGAGLGPIGWTLAIFHLLVHGFFKAQLFLGAGSVMHAMNDQVNIRRFGALRTAMKLSCVTFGIAWLAIMGIPPFSGFFSKDPIIEAAFNPSVFGETGAWIFGLVAMLGAGITALYMSRLFFAIFFGEKRWTGWVDEQPKVHPHEPSWLMNGPILVLSVFSAGLGGVLGLTGWFVDWLEPVTGTKAAEEAAHHLVLDHNVISALTLALVLLGAGAGWYLYAKQPMPLTPKKSNFAVEAARRDFYQDSLNEALVVAPVGAFAKATGIFDRQVVDGIVRLTGWLSLKLGSGLRALQHGNMRGYVGYMSLGVVCILALILGSQLL